MRRLPRNAPWIGWLMGIALIGFPQAYGRHLGTWGHVFPIAETDGRTHLAKRVAQSTGFPASKPLPAHSAFCQGFWPDPIRDLDWNGFFPVTLGGYPVSGSGLADKTPRPRSAWCMCPIRGLELGMRMGINMGYWEPIGLVDVGIHPHCWVGMGGKQTPGVRLPRHRIGKIGQSGPTDGHSFWWAHYYTYGFGSLLPFTGCGQHPEKPLIWGSEWDPSWTNEQWAQLQIPPIHRPPIGESAVSALIRHGACAANRDQQAACMGTHGWTFPLTGEVQSHTDRARSSELIAERVLYKLHRYGWIRHFGLRADGQQAACTHPYIRHLTKSRYRIQRLYPRSADGQTGRCHALGTSDGSPSGRSFASGAGDHFAYLIWRKRDCCLSWL